MWIKTHRCLVCMKDPWNRQTSRQTHKSKYIASRETALSASWRLPKSVHVSVKQSQFKRTVTKQSWGKNIKKNNISFLQILTPTIILHEPLSKILSYHILVALRNEFNFWNVHGIMNTSGHTRSIHDSMNIPNVECIAYIYILL